jgi:hypothetical protein
MCSRTSSIAERSPSARNSLRGCMCLLYTAKATRNVKKVFKLGFHALPWAYLPSMTSWFAHYGTRQHALVRIIVTFGHRHHKDKRYCATARMLLPLKCCFSIDRWICTTRAQALDLQAERSLSGAAPRNCPSRH